MDARSDVDVSLVEHDPGLGLLGGGSPLDRNLLDEAGDRSDRGVDILIELSIETDPLGQLDGANGRSPLLIAIHHLRRDRRRWAVNL